MQIKKKNVNKTLTIFLFAHVVIWTLVPTISNNNLPLDTIEALAWGTDLSWGYNKHPPFSAWSVEFFYQIFGSQDWAYYFLSQIFVIFSFYIIFKFSEYFFKERIYSLFSIFLLEGIYFYNFTTPEFNVNVCQLPFWALTVYFCFRAIKTNKISDWLLLGIFAAFGVLSKYLFFYLIASLIIFFIYTNLKKKKFNFRYLIALAVFLIVLSPHLIWLMDNDYAPIIYAFHRTGIENFDFIQAHLLNPLVFFGKQLLLLIPFFIMLYFMISKLKLRLNIKDKKLLFLLIINIVPLILMFLTSLLMGVKIRTMWMTPFYLFLGVFFIYIFQKKIIIKKTKYFLLTFLFLFILSPTTYFYISVTQNDKRTDYPGEKISQIVQQQWKNNFQNKIGLIGGDEWHGGNLSYHLKSRPKWDNILESKKSTSVNNIKDGFVLIGDPNILTKICTGVFFKVENQGVCMIGKRK
tara:strand:- start:896 stop:2284 length:1389 start_codon:yes stop_codon:yes gene_type:complete